MFKALEEIRDFLEAGLNDYNLILVANTVPSGGETVSSFSAQPVNTSMITVQAKTNTGDVAAGSVTITGTDDNGATISEDVVFEANDTNIRFTNQLFKTVSSIVWPAQDGSTATWDVGVAKFSKFYVGKIKYPPINYLPILMVYPESTEITASTTATDKSIYSIVIEIVVNIYAYAGTDGIDGTVPDKVAQIQKGVIKLMEARDADYSPSSDSILGLIRSNIKGTNYNFNRDINITYEEELEKGSVFFRGRMTLQGYRDHQR